MKPPVAAVGFEARFREAILASAGRVSVLPDVYYGQLQGVARAEAFSIAGIAKLDQLQGALNSLTTAIHQGMSFEQWKEEVLKKSPEVAALPAHRLDNIFRTNIQGAYARGRCVHAELHKDSRPFLMYSAINDARVRPHHLAMSGHVAPIGDSIWQKWTPPCGYRCRCTVISLTESQAKARGAKDSDRLQNDHEAAQARSAAINGGPDAGWDYSPCDAKWPGATPPMKKSWAEKAATLHPKLAAKVAAIAEQAIAIKDTEDPNTWKKIGDKKGSNAGGLYEAADGRKWYVKEYHDPDQARSEIAAQGMYRLLGLETPNLRLVVMNGKTALASEWMEGLAQPTIEAMVKQHAAELNRIYAMSALVKNWDVVGMSMDNIAITKTGKLVVIDAGGSFKFRAQGKFKAFLAGPVDELATMADPSRTAGRVFSQLSEAKRTAGIRALEAITKKQINEVFTLAGFDASAAKELTGATWARRKWMLETVANQGKKAVAVNAASMTAAQAKTILESAVSHLHEMSSRGITGTINEWARDYKWTASEAPFKSAIRAYTGGDYKQINRALRNEQHGVLEQVADVINHGLAEMRKYTGNVSRGVTYTVDMDWINRHKEALRLKVPVEYKGFLSTDDKGRWKKTVRLEIEAKGLQGAWVDDFSLHQGEREILFPHLSRFFVTNVRKDSFDHWIISVKEDPKAMTGKAIRLSANP